MNRSIRTKMISQILPVVLVVMVFSIIVSSLMSIVTQRQHMYDEMFETARRYANEFNAQMKADMAVSQMLALIMESDTSLTRQEVLTILHRLLREKPHVIGTYVGYEPNAFDGNDSKYVNTPGSDATGRFVPYWNRLTGVESLDPLLNMDSSDWYIIPKRTKSDEIIEPLMYEGVLMTSIISPIIKDGRFLGIAGMDVTLTRLDKTVQKIKIFKTGYAFLVSNHGVFVSYPDKKLIGTKTLSQLGKEIRNPYLERISSDIKQGKEGYVELVDSITKKKVVMFYEPIQLGQWGMVIVAPIDEMLSATKKLEQVLLFIGFASLVLVGGAIVWVSKALSAPIVALSKTADRVAAGDFEIHVPEQEGELGVLALAFNNMVERLRQSFELVNQKVDELAVEVSHRRKAEDALRLNYERTQTLLQLNHMAGANISEIETFAFDAALRLSKSKIGFLGVLTEDESVIEVHVWSKDVLPECSVTTTSLRFSVPEGGLWAESVRQRRVVIVNDYTAANPLKKGCPQGHIVMSRVLIVPVIIENRIVLLAGVGNKQEDYDQTDVQQLTLLLEGLWRLIERKRVERMLLLNRMSIDSAWDAIVWATEDAQILFCNDALSRLLGYSKDELLKMRISDYDIMFTPEKFADLWKKLLVDNSAVFETKMRSKDGLIVEGEITATYVSYENEEYLLCFLRDISERKAAEKQIKQMNALLEQRVAERTVQLEAANKELEAFSYSVSHDLRAPLRGISGFIQALMEDYGDKLNSNGNNILKRINSACQRMEQLINDMLSLSCVMNSEMNFVVVELSALVANITQELHDTEPQRCAEFIIASGVVARADQNLMRILFENLLGNSWKFTSKHATARIEFGMKSCDGQNIYFVKDDGAGFDMAYAGSLFNSFRRLHSVIEFEGTGIGLATVHRIVKRHGGRVWAEGAVEQGATIYFTLS